MLAVYVGCTYFCRMSRKNKLYDYYLKWRQVVMQWLVWTRRVLTQLYNGLLHASLLAFCQRLKSVLIAATSSIDERLAMLRVCVVVVTREAATAWTSHCRLVADFCTSFTNSGLRRKQWKKTLIHCDKYLNLWYEWQCNLICDRDLFAVFSERELKFMFAICHRRSVCRLSSVTFVRPTQTIEIFDNVSTP